MRVLALLLPLVVLAGCAGPPVVTPVPTPTATPVFASDEEALAAAEKAYAAYLAVSDEILHDGGARPERLLSVATQAVADQEAAGFESFHDKQYKSVGSSTFEHMQLQFYDSATSDSSEAVRVYVCVDSSAVDVVDRAGASVVPPDRQTRFTFEVGFVTKGAAGRVLLVSSKAIWDGEGVCD